MKVSQEHITAMMSEVTYHPMNDGTATIVLAKYKGFTLGKGFSACIDPTEYDQCIGEEVATEDAMRQAEDTLWQLEGWVAFKTLNGLG